jgi:hypothetical protein
MKEANILLIGLGHHSRRIYFPKLIKFEKDYPIKVVAGVELTFSKEILEDYFKKSNRSIDMLYLEPFDPQKPMPKAVEVKLNSLVKDKDISAVVISTDPLSHKVYAQWALKNGLNILMDKPISTRKYASTKMKSADGIQQDYFDLLNEYNELQKKKNTIFSVNVQRRYETGFKKVFELIEEVAKKFNAPVTSIQAMHSDGVWIFPDEIIEQKTHPYSEGYGKCSHSGYHIFDIIWRFYLSGLVAGKAPDSAEVFTSFINPGGLLKQFSLEDYQQYFGEEIKNHQNHHESDLFDIFEDYGENDAFSVVRFLKDNHAMCNVSINLLHNGFSRRSWMLPNKDLYKGNGRVKHQYYHIQQGPFQCIQIHNYQANDNQDVSTIKDYELGGNNHFDIYVFRNSRMFGPDEQPLKVINIKALDRGEFEDSRLYHEIAKNGVIIEFIEYITGLKTDKKLLKSNITTHEMGVKIMSSIYKSEILNRSGKNPLVKFKVEESSYEK